MHYNNAKSAGIVTQKLICWHLQRDIMHVRLTQYLKTWRDGTARWVWWNIGFTTATTTYAGHCWWLQFCCWIQKYSILQRHEAIRWHHLQIVNKQCHNISNKINQIHNSSLTYQGVLFLLTVCGSEKTISLVYCHCQMVSETDEKNIMLTVMLLTSRVLAKLMANISGSIMSVWLIETEGQSGWLNKNYHTNLPISYSTLQYSNGKLPD